MPSRRIASHAAGAAESSSSASMSASRVAPSCTLSTCSMPSTMPASRTAGVATWSAPLPPEASRCSDASMPARSGGEKAARSSGS
eukprot:scaffold92245_cov24-Tisochrysis_lutea.AAC.2